MPDAFWSKVDVRGPEECWPWTAAKNPQTGYGVFHPSRALVDLPRTVTAHRMMAYLTGMMPALSDSHFIDHTCHNNAGCPPGPCPHRLCVNPAHLDLTTNAENIARSHNANQHKTHCPRGHAYTPQNTRLQVKASTTSRKCITCEKERVRA